MRIKRTRGEVVFDTINTILLIFVFLLTLYPFLYVVFASLSNANKLAMHRGFLVWPIGFSLSSYESVLKNHSIWIGFRNTLFYELIGLSINMSLTILGGYALSRKRFAPRGVIMMLVVFCMIFKGGLIPNYILIRQLSLLDTVWALTLPVAISTMNLIIMRTAFEAMPESLEEAAKMDGASDLTVLLRVAIPLTVPTILTLVLYYAVSHWNSWFPASIYITSRSKLPLQMILREILLQGKTGDTSGDVSENMTYLAASYKYSTIVVSTLPILMVYPFIQRYFVKGVMVGAVKG